MTHDQSPLRQSWTLTAWSCFGAIGVMTLLLVTIFDTHGNHPEIRAARDANAVKTLERPAADRRASETLRN